MFFSYLKSRARLIIILAAFALIFALVFSLYELPAEAVWYSAGLCAILGAAATLLCLKLVGADAMLLPALVIIVVVLLVLRKRLEDKPQENQEVDSQC